MKRGSKNNVSNESVDMDPYSTSLLDQLLETPKQWKNVDDIVKLTLRAISDIINLHGTSLKDIKALLITRASKTQLTTGLALKASVSDMSRGITELSTGLDSKVSFTDMQSALRDFVHRSDFQEVLANRSLPEQSRISGIKQLKNHEPMQLTLLQARMDDFQRQVSKKIAGCVTLSQFQDILNIVEQKANVSEVNQALQNKVSKQYLSTCLQKKTNKNQVEQMLLKKADTADLQYIVNSLQSKVSLNTLQKLTQVIQNKADKSDLVFQASERQRAHHEDKSEKFGVRNELEIGLKEIKQKIQELKREMEGQKIIRKKELDENKLEVEKKIHNFYNENQEQIKIIKSNLKLIQEQLNTKIKNQSFIKEMANEVNIRKRCEQKIYEQIDDVRRRAQEISGTSLEKRQFIDFKSQIIGIIQEKIEAEEVQVALNKWEAQINEKFAVDKEETLNLLRNVQKSLGEEINLLNNDVATINTLLIKKHERVQTSFNEEMVKKIRRQVQDCRKTIDLLYTQMQGKIGISEYESDLLEFRKRFDNIHKDISLKANIKDVCVLSDSKPNIDDVNKAFKQINTALTERISQADLRSILKDQAAINEILCSENIVGRWLWQTGDLKPGGLIPWEVQCANTVPDYFFWEKDKTSILVLVAGIYELTACLFNQVGQLGILVNGQLIGNKPPTDALVRKNSMKKKKDKDINGIKTQEYVILPSRSRISLNSTVQGSQAFLSIRRL